MSRPLTSTDIQELLLIKVPPAPARAQFNIDTVALIDARKELKITGAIQFRWTTSGTIHGGTKASVIGKKITHYILLEQNSTDLKGVNNTLWHELAHCAQLEAFIRAGKTWRDYDKAYISYGRGGTKGYLTNPFEVDANNTAKEYGEVMLIKRPASVQ